MTAHKHMQKTRDGAWRRSGFAAMTAFALLGALSGCISYLATPLTAKDPEIIHATKDEISIAAWGWNRPDNIASEHCRRFEREAVFLATQRTEEYDDQRIVYYRCQ